MINLDFFILVSIMESFFFFFFFYSAVIEPGVILKSADLSL